jgi:acyl carrier protein
MRESRRHRTGEKPREAVPDVGAAPAERADVIAHAVRDVVGSVLRVKPDGLRLDQPLTDLGLDSLMAVEIENSIESSIGVALPPASLMRARTIGQIATLITEHMGGAVAAASTAPVAADAPIPTDDVDLEALSDEEIDRLLEGVEEPLTKQLVLKIQA